MKSCDEVAQSLKKRRDIYIANQKNRKKVRNYSIIFTCCICLIAVLSFGLWRICFFDMIPSVSLGSIDYTNGQDKGGHKNSDYDTNTEQVQGNQEGIQTKMNSYLFVINNTDSVMTTDMDVQISDYTGLDAKEFQIVQGDFENEVKLDYESAIDRIPEVFLFEAFYSVDIPTDDSRTEYVPHDYVFEYRTANGTVIIALCAKDKPLKDCIVTCNSSKQSKINDVDVMIYTYEDSYFVCFTLGEVNYNITTSNVSVEELESLLKAIILYH